VLRTQARLSGRCWLSGLALAISTLAFPSRVDAHRLDEYLQAAQITIATDSIHLNVYLTPGVSVTPSLLTTLDPDGDDVLTGTEVANYARTVLAGLSVSIDHRPLALVFDGSDASPVAELRDGVGSVHLAAHAVAAGVSAGHHQLEFDNRFAPVDSVYLANAMVPVDSRIAIRSQERDNLQTKLAIDYDVTDTSHVEAGAIAAATVVAVLTLGLLLWQRQAGGVGGDSKPK
jgi:hypothetical protein